jgi:MFS family permease
MDAELHLSPSSIGFITGAGQFAAILAPLLAPRLATRRSHAWTLMATTLGMGASLLPLALIPHWTAAGLGRFGILVLSAVSMRSLAYGAVSMAMGLSYGSASLAGGYIIAATGYRSFFLIGVGLSAAGALVMWGILKRRSTESPTTAIPMG